MTNNNFKRCVIAGVASVLLSGCVGSNVATSKLMEYNVKAVDNRYARGGLNIAMSPLYAVTVSADYLVLNSLEFWTGENPVSGQAHIFDTKTDTWLDINNNIDESLHSAPIKVSSSE
ncbi:DUF3332 domain-containing protein [Photobacterium gaetbulicola]|uniref:Lipoprotein n=1 Tax=Photobacterium gaetbulicola Gung47 TaxID=658445 RepID=A0A0C5WJJ9_9GAMM|nr:hypothetical protein H744_1c0238 [Photobacterium gaetbulicola Gung47]PSU06095.1 DUF3332 domain-containing protein [Photobacterium gaetbulicola]